MNLDSHPHKPAEFITGRIIYDNITTSSILNFLISEINKQEFRFKENSRPIKEVGGINEANMITLFGNIITAEGFDTKKISAVTGEGSGLIENMGWKRVENEGTTRQLTEKYQQPIHFSQFPWIETDNRRLANNFIKQISIETDKSKILNADLRRSWDSFGEIGTEERIGENNNLKIEDIDSEIGKILTEQGYELIYPDNQNPDILLSFMYFHEVKQIFDRYANKAKSEIPHDNFKYIFSKFNNPWSKDKCLQELYSELIYLGQWKGYTRIEIESEVVLDIRRKYNLVTSVTKKARRDLGKSKNRPDIESQ